MGHKNICDFQQDREKYFTFLMLPVGGCLILTTKANAPPDAGTRSGIYFEQHHPLRELQNSREE
jgi:hypothetical protein